LFRTNVYARFIVDINAGVFLVGVHYHTAQPK
jgi:hypothetical protein